MKWLFTLYFSNMLKTFYMTVNPKKSFSTEQNIKLCQEQNLT